MSLGRKRVALVLGCVSILGIGLFILRQGPIDARCIESSREGSLVLSSGKRVELEVGWGGDVGRATAGAPWTVVPEVAARKLARTAIEPLTDWALLPGGPGKPLLLTLECDGAT